MFQPASRSTTAMGKTALVLFALVGLLLALFSITGPTLGAHDTAGSAVQPVEVSFANPQGYEVNQGGNVTCPVGTEIKIEPPTWTKSDTLPGQTSPTVVSATVSGNTVTNFTVTNGLAAYVLVKATNSTNVYDYSDQPDGGIAHDDGLVSPATDSISHISFCVIAQPPTGDLLINKTTGAGTALPGVTFTLTGTGFTTRVDVTDASGQANFDDLPAGTYTLTETTPAGHQPAGPWTVTVSATGVVTVSGLSPNEDGSFNIANQLIVTVPPTGDLLINKTTGASTALPGVTFTLTGTGFTTRVDVTDASGQANFDDLPAGTYTLTETTPADFQPAGPWTVTVSATGVVTVSGLTANANGSFTIVNTRSGTLSGSPTVVATPTPTPAPVRQGTLTSTGVPNTAASLETAGLTGAGLLGLLMVAGAGAFVFANVLTARRRR